MRSMAIYDQNQVLLSSKSTTSIVAKHVAYATCVASFDKTQLNMASIFIQTGSWFCFAKSDAGASWCSRIWFWSKMASIFTQTGLYPVCESKIFQTGSWCYACSISYMLSHLILLFKIMTNWVPPSLPDAVTSWCYACSISYMLSHLICVCTTN